MRRRSDRDARWRQPTQVLTGSIVTPFVGLGLELLVFENAVGLHVNFCARQFCGQTNVLPLFADR